MAIFGRSFPITRRYKFNSLIYTPIVADCLHFDGVNDDLTIADASWNDFGSNNFTVEAWINKKAATSGWTNLVGVSKWNTGGSPGTNEWLLSLTTDGSNNLPMFWIEIGSTQYTVAATTSMSLDTWYHIAGVREGTNIKIYINGVLEGTTSCGSGAINNISGRIISLAKIAGFSDWTKKEMDELRIWSVARTAAEILATKNCEIPTSYANLLANYHFNQGIAGGSNPTETSLTDSSGNGYNGTLTNFALTGATSNWIKDSSPASGTICVFSTVTTKKLAMLGVG